MCSVVRGLTTSNLCRQVSIDNFTFKLFYKWSVSLLIASSVTVFSGQFFGDPIHCDIVRPAAWELVNLI